MKITHDLHVHTTISGCANKTATAENYLKYARENDIKKIGFADRITDILGIKESDLADITK